MKKFAQVICVLVLIDLFSTVLHAESKSESISGNVLVVGNRINRKVLIEGDKSKNTICKTSKVLSSLQKLQGMKLSLKGKVTTSTNKKGRISSCFQAEVFSIERTSTGKKALIGKLVKNEDRYSIETAFTSYALANPLPGLPDLLGKEVIVSIEDGVNLKNTKNLKIHSFMPYPLADQ